MDSSNSVFEGLPVYVLSLVFAYQYFCVIVLYAKQDNTFQFLYCFYFHFIKPFCFYDSIGTFCYCIFKRISTLCHANGDSAFLKFHVRMVYNDIDYPYPNDESALRLYVHLFRLMPFLELEADKLFQVSDLQPNRQFYVNKHRLSTTDNIHLPLFQRVLYRLPIFR